MLLKRVVIAIAIAIRRAQQKKHLAGIRHGVAVGFHTKTAINRASRLRRQAQTFNAFRNLQRLPRHHRHRNVVQRGENCVGSGRNIANLKLPSLCTSAPFSTRLKSLDCSMMAALEPGGRFTTEPRMLRLGWALTKNSPGNYRRHVTGSVRLVRDLWCRDNKWFGRRQAQVSRRAVRYESQPQAHCRGFDQASEVGRRRDRNKIVSAARPRCGMRRDRWCARLQPAPSDCVLKRKSGAALRLAPRAWGRRPHRSRAPQPPPRIGDE